MRAAGCMLVDGQVSGLFIVQRRRKERVSSLNFRQPEVSGRVKVGDENNGSIFRPVVAQEFDKRCGVRADAPAEFFLKRNAPGDDFCSTVRRTLSPRSE